MIFPFFKKIVFWGILGPPYYGIGATIRIGREMLCLPFAGFFLDILALITVSPGKSGAQIALLETPREHFEGSIIPGGAL
jgi:hypothetical protein